MIERDAPRDEALDRAVRGGFDLDVGALLRQARGALPGSKRVVWVGVLAWLGSTWLVGLVTLALGLGQLLAASLGVLATTPFTVGLVMVGLRRARGDAVTVGDLVSYGAATPRAAIVLLTNVIVLNVAESLLGPVASLPVTLAYALFTGFSLFLVADRGLGGFAAIAASFRLVGHRWAKLLLLQLLLAALLLVAALPFGLGLIWAVPYAVVAMGAAFEAAVPATLSTASRNTRSG